MERKLAAILYADVAGYSRLTGQDEERTHRTLGAYLDILAATIAEHGGKVVHYAGDAVLADFVSVVAALTCAVAVQEDLEKRNQALAEIDRLRFRVGINLGEVIVDRNDIYGDGVNVAARLEALAEPGGICVSGSVHDQVAGKVDFGFEDMGRKTVKNIAQPVRAFRVRPHAGADTLEKTRGRRRRGKWILGAVAALVVAGTLGMAGHLGIFPLRDPAPAKQTQLAFPLPDKPSIAIMPFDNMSGDKEQGYFADGITEDIITRLSQLADLFVISRTSTFAYRDTGKTVQQVAGELGVRYVLEGSVRKSGDKMRITAQLIDALSDRHVWAESYDRAVTELFSVQDEITLEICTALRVELTEGQQARIWRSHSRNLKAWSALSRGFQHFYAFTSEEIILAREHFQKAIDADFGYALGYAALAWTHLLDAMFSWTAHPSLSLEHAETLAVKAQALDDTLPDVYALMAMINLYKRDYDKALAFGEKAVSLNPNHATNIALLATVRNNTGQPARALKGLKKATRLSPYYPNWILVEVGDSYAKTDQFEEAEKVYKELLDRKPSRTHALRAHIGLATAFNNLGREDDARLEIVNALRLNSEVSVAYLRTHSFHQDQEAEDRYFAVLRGLGLPE